jgi:hypothetical protein
MPEPPAIAVGDEVEMRKPHACGGSRWVLVRTGADLRVKCLGCGRSLLMPRDQFNKALRRVVGRITEDTDERR